MILHELLECAEQRGYASVVRWQEHGRAFRIHNRQEILERVLPLYFEKQGAYTSFQRQLNSYGFLRLNASGPDQKAYYHELFLRGKAHLAARVGRGYSSSSRVRRRWDPTTEPDLCALAPLPASSWRPSSSLGLPGETNGETDFSLQTSGAASMENEQNERKRQKQEAALDHQKRLEPLSHQPCSKHKRSDSDISEPSCLLSSSQRMSNSSNSYLPVPPSDCGHHTNAPCPRDQAHGFYRFERHTGSIERTNKAQSLDCALLPQWLASNWRTDSTVQESHTGRTTTGTGGDIATMAASSRSTTEFGGQHDRVQSPTPSMGTSTYDRIFSDRLLHSTAALPMQHTVSAVAATGSSTEGYSHHAMTHVHNPAAIASLGASQGSTSLSYQPHTLGVHPVPPNNIGGARCPYLGHVNERNRVTTACSIPILAPFVGTLCRTS
jgi:HSF-type DNA-binding